MNKKLSCRLEEFRNIVVARSKKDTDGIVVISASIPRLFISVLEMDYGQRESDALAVWNEYLSGVKNEHLI